MEAMTIPNAPSIDAVIAAAGMTCFAEDCDVIVVRRTPRITEVLVPAAEVVPPFQGD